jgi:WD40 repeat protein
VWDVATAATLQTLPYLATAVAWSPDGTQVLSSNWVGRLGVRIWDAATGNEVTGLPVDAGGGISFLPDGRTLLLGRNGGGGFTYWNLSPGVAERTVSLALPGWSKSYATCLDFSPDLRTAFTMWANCIMLWDTDTGKRRATLASLAGDDWLAVSADGHYRGSPGVERELVYVVEIDAGEQLTLTPEEFATRYHWKNDPSQVRLAPEPAAKQPSAPPAAGAEKP